MNDNIQKIIEKFVPKPQVSSCVQMIETELSKEPVENKDGEIPAFEKLEDIELLLLDNLGVELNDSFKRGFKLARMSKKEFEAIKEGD